MSATVAISPEGNLTRYLRRVYDFPMLEAGEEMRLARRWQKNQDPAAVEKLVNSHLRLVAKIAKKYRGYGLPLGELIAEGNVGIMQAVSRFDPDRGFRLSTYAMWWIRAAIQEYVLRSWSMVRMGTTASQKKLFFNLRRLKSQIQALEDGDLDPDNVALIARKLGVSETDVVAMNRRLLGPDPSLNAPRRGQIEGQWQDWLVQDGMDQETRLAKSEELGDRQHLLGGALKALSRRERSIITERRLKEFPKTLEDLSHHYGISRERVRQIEAEAFLKLRKSMKNAIISRNIGC